MLVIGLHGVKVNSNNNNLAQKQEAPPVLPHELVELLPAYFVRDMTDPNCKRPLPV